MCTQGVCNGQFYESAFGSSSSQRRLIIQVHLCILCYCNKYYRTIRQVVVFACIYIYIWRHSHIGDPDDTTRIMDSTRIDDLQQYTTQIHSLQEQLRNRTTNSPMPAEISRVAVRLPPFWAERPAVWFAQAEAQFSLAGVNNEENQILPGYLAAGSPVRDGG
jgi:hypothetical protein